MKIDKRFCVIGPDANFPGGRTWFESTDDCIMHAGKLLYLGSNSATELYVVQIVKVVRPKSNYEVMDVE